MTFFTFPNAQAGDAVTVDRWNALEAAFTDFANGSADAPRIKGGALAGDDEFLITVAASSDYEITRGLSVVQDTVGNNTDSYVVGYAITVNSYTGSIRFSITIDGNSPSTDHDLRIRKESGGSSTILQTWSGNGEQTRTIDVPVAVGDVISWEHRHDSGIASSTVSNPIQRGDARLVEFTAIDEGT